MSKKYFRQLLFLSTLVMLFASSPFLTQAEGLKGKVTIWYWDDTYIKKMTTAFNKQYPDIIIENTPVQSGDYARKVQISVATGLELPDIIMGEIGFRGKIFDLDIWENLEKRPYNFNRKSYFDYLIPTMTDSKDRVVGIEQSINAAGLAYNRSLAIKYFGTDDPKKLQAMMPTWDKFIAKGKEVKTKSNGSVFMFPSLDDVEMIILNQNPVSLMKGNVMNGTGTAGKVLDMMIKMRNAGIVGKLNAWTPAWYASFTSEKYIFYPCPTWFPRFFIQPNDKDKSVIWGMIMPPGGGFSWGGTTMSIPKSSKNKEMAWLFIKWCQLSQEGAKANKELCDNPVPLKTLYQDPTFLVDKNPWFGGQDIGEVYYKEIAPTLKVRPISKYDLDYSDVMGLIVRSLNQEMSWDTKIAFDKFKAEMKNKNPDLTIR
ncbi:MAG TPA: ABC transporter substrate-binding protein [Firmicutes bacterium]|jgi:multiple sugar transport system substrate-binding protein|nr:ABC transporter substrate-binding protein [Bacillota bacterium]